MVTAVLRGEMRLIVLALKDVAEEVDDVYIAGENTGIGSVLANKVCVVYRVQSPWSHVSFVFVRLNKYVIA